MKRSALIVAAAAACVIAAAIAAGITGNEAGSGVPPAAPRIFGSTAPSKPAPKPSGNKADAERVARQWTAAWGRVTACPGASPRSLERVLALSAGELQHALTAQPPRPTGEPAGRCKPPRVKHVRVHLTDEGWFAIATRHGDGLRPLRLRLATTTAGRVRVTAIDF